MASISTSHEMTRAREIVAMEIRQTEGKLANLQDTLRSLDRVLADDDGQNSRTSAQSGRGNNAEVAASGQAGSKQKQGATRSRKNAADAGKTPGKRGRKSNAEKAALANAAGNAGGAAESSGTTATASGATAEQGAASKTRTTTRKSAAKQTQGTPATAGTGATPEKRGRGRPTNAELAARQAAGVTDMPAKRGPGRPTKEEAAARAAAAAANNGQGQSAPAKSAAAKQIKSKPVRKSKADNAASNTAQQQTSQVAHSEIVPDTGEDFWLSLIGKNPQNHEEIFRAAKERLDNKLSQAAERKIHTRMENTLRQLVKDEVILTEGRGDEKTFFRQ